ncbi:serine hydrolase [Sinosporangium siamense]|uniref:Beta-lactamase class A catalytic domain-containing protein n=1 Tax=Sinosporangium siamense TaxID=1367973 RepID=A0A919RGW6_9ACTN|nr:serine hydrolase [Sinosporangium siamense]GII91614.1 hypothetical protein Ssi02_18450 [Sinosporangium siamense]
MSRSVAMTLSTIAAFALLATAFLVFIQRGQQARATAAPTPAPTGTAAPELKTPDDVLAYLAANKDDTALLHLPHLDHNEDRWFSFASTFKIFHLAAYVTAVDKGKINPNEKVPVKTWNAYHIPGTDGGAHEAALKRLKAGTTVTIDEMVSAMITESDNAAADYLRARLGERALIAAAKAAGGPAPRRVDSVNGNVLRLAGCKQSPDVCLKRYVAKGGSSTTPTLARWEEQAALFHKLTRTTPETLNKLINAIAKKKYVSEKASELARKHLEWPMRQEAPLPPQLKVYGGKGGALAGVLTEAAYYITPEGDVRTMVLAMNNMPPTTWASALTSYAHQAFMIRVALDPAYRDKVKATLGQ